MSAREYAAKRLHEFQNGGTCDAEDVIDAIIKAARAEIPEWTFSAQIRQPAKIQGYTAEQWQEIIDGGYLCEFADLKGFGGLVYEKLQKVCEGSSSVRFCHYRAGSFKYCRPAQIKGVMRPIFAEPVDFGSTFIFFKGIDPLGNGTFPWSSYCDGNMYIKHATSYLEV